MLEVELSTSRLSYAIVGPLSQYRVRAACGADTESQVLPSLFKNKWYYRVLSFVQPSFVLARE